MDYDEFYNADHATSNAPNACKKVLRVIKLVDQNPEPVVEPMEIDEDETSNIFCIALNAIHVWFSSTLPLIFSYFEGKSRFE